MGLEMQPNEAHGPIPTREADTEYVDVSIPTGTQATGIELHPNQAYGSICNQLEGQRSSDYDYPYAQPLSPIESPSGGSPAARK